MGKYFRITLKNTDLEFLRVRTEIENLAVMTHKGFARVDDRFDSLEIRIS